jgi:protein-disulfide isomerase
MARQIKAENPIINDNAGKSAAVDDSNSGADSTSQKSLSSLIKQEIRNNQLSSSNNEKSTHYNDNNQPSTAKQPALERESADVNPSEKKGLTVDIDKITETSTHVIYGQTKIQKIGFDVNGGKLSAQDQITQVQGIFKSIEEKSDSWTVAYKAKEEKTSVVVFSDPTCGFCRMLHKDIPKLNDEGVSVYILYYPRSLMAANSTAAAKTVDSMRASWCSENPSEALNRLYKGDAINPNLACEAPKSQGRANFPVSEHYLLGRVFDLNATPLIISKNGKKIYGYSNTKKLLAHILPE